MKKRAHSRRQRLEAAKDALKELIRENPESVRLQGLADAYEGEKRRLEETESEIDKKRNAIVEAGYEFLLDEE